MEDDIDIEEHDVLDNPAIKNMFPDLSVIKKEIQQYYEDVPEIAQDNEVQIKSEAQSQEQFIVDIQRTSQDQKIASLKMKVETSETETMDLHPRDEINPDSIDDTHNESTISSIQFRSNKIILGSKPNNLHIVDEYEMFFEKQLTTIQPKVLVEDMQPYLKRSGRYCMSCATLFPNFSALDFHNKTTHSLIKPECDKKAKRKMVGKNFISGMKCVKCNFCKNNFTNQCNLKRHLKNVHSVHKYKINVSLFSNEKNNFKCNLCGETFANRPNLLKHAKAKHKISQAEKTNEKNDGSMLKRKILRNTQRKVPVKLVKQSESDKINKMIKRVRNQMQTSEQSSLDENSTCFHCSTKFTSPQSLIEHLYQVLQSKLPETVQKTTEILQKHVNKDPITSSVDFPKKQTRESNSASQKCLYYRCHVCSYYFKNTMSYVAHLANNHKITTHIKLNNVPFDSKCRFCQETMVDISTYNLHLKEMHAPYYKTVQKTDSKSIIKSTESEKIKIKNLNIESISESGNQLSSENTGYTNSLVLKSTIFKCNKCDIYFLSAGSTVNHSDHMELLVNWKCSQCNRIFKKNDEKFHEKQHLYSEIFNVLDLPDTALRRVLYGCPKCTVHFNEDKFIKHYPKCGTEAPNSTYCKFCDILIDDSIGKTHKLSHQYDNLKSTDFPVIVTDIIECNPSKHGECSSQTSNNLKREHKNREIYLKSEIDKLTPQYKKIKPKQCSVVVTKNIIEQNRNMLVEGELQKSKVLKRKYIDDKKSDLTIKSKKKHHRFNNTIMFDLTYCPTCKCYLTDSLTRNVHLQGNCGHLSRHICKSCGLVITMGSYRGHTSLHNQIKNLKLQDFRFYELKSGKQISPLIPEFPKCINCEVRFVSKMASLNHDCCGEDFLTCHICEVKFSEAAFKLHMLFHNYSNDTITQTMESNIEKLEKDRNANLQSPTDMLQNHTNDTSIFRKSEINVIKINSNEPKAAVCTMIVDQIARDTENTYPNADGKYISDVQLRLSSTQKIDKIESRDHEIDTSEKVAVRALCQSPDSTTDLIKESIDTIPMTLLFTCMNCNISVDSYDRAVEHCQQHFIQKEWNLEFGLCPICNVKLDKHCLATHLKLHSVFKYSDTNFFRELKFDAFYLTAKCDVWIKHVFGSLQQTEIDKILSNSVYKYEYKLKMDVIQDGPPDLTVYKCEKCRCFIDETSLNRHAENACFKLRRHPCTFCGLAFISSLARIEHEKIHKRPNISAKSYRIVTFNREKDKTLNTALSCIQFVLYQCRNCNVTVDKSQKRDHKCNDNDRHKCLECGLLVNITEYDLHQSRHKELNHFTKYLKIIMFGDKVDDTQNFEELIPTYEGDIYDYTFYKCAKCHICVKNIQMKHICSFGSSRTKCACCGLFFMTGKFKYHRKFHEIDPDFTRDNMRIILFNTESQEISSISINQLPPLSITNNVKEMGHLKIDNLEQDANKTELNNEHKTANIYKCTCGLCFLDETYAFIHHKSCNPKTRTAIQRCSKCDFVFSPNVLFQHLLAHHGDKKIVYSFNVIDIGKQSLN